MFLYVAFYMTLCFNNTHSSLLHSAVKSCDKGHMPACYLQGLIYNKQADRLKLAETAAANGVAVPTKQVMLSIQ